MRLHWATHPEVIHGLGAGYTRTNEHMRLALRAAGVDLTEDAPVAVHLCNPRAFRPIPHKRNVLFTMTEFSPVDPKFPAAFRAADLVLAPSSFVARVFRRPCRRAKVALEVSRLGCDVERFRLAKHSLAGGRDFVWLWVGAPNRRKGWDSVVAIWERLFSDAPNVRLVLKTSVADSSKEQVIERGNVTFDSRTYTDDEMAGLYAGAHGFIFPTNGEGFGLTPLEALATGLPVVATGYSGHLDFLSDRNSTLVPYSLVDSRDGWGNPIRSAVVAPADLGRAMIDVMCDYGAALEKARAGSELVTREFTWARAAQELVKNIEKTFPLLPK